MCALGVENSWEGCNLQREAAVSRYGTPRASGLGASIPDLCSLCISQWPDGFPSAV